MQGKSTAFFSDHFVVKGKEANACVQTIGGLRSELNTGTEETSRKGKVLAESASHLRGTISFRKACHRIELVHNAILCG
jgi:hypothetical protein